MDIKPITSLTRAELRDLAQATARVQPVRAGHHPAHQFRERLPRAPAVLLH